MSFARSFVLLGLLFWAGAILAAGIAAATAFPTMESIGARMPGHWALETDQQWRVVAGQLMDRIFGLTDRIQAGGAAAAVIGLVMERALAGRAAGSRGWASRVRLFSIAAAMAILAVRMTALGPGMREDLHAYWAAAEEGRHITAAEHQHAFNELHPLASRLLTVNLALVLVAVTVSPAVQRRVDAAAGETAS